MTEWYYRSAQGQQHGPVATEMLLSLHRNGLLSAEVLVWREGMADWTPWRDVVPTLIEAPAPASSPVMHTADATVADPRAMDAYTVHAGFLKRFAARVIDSLVLLGLCCTIGLPLSLLSGLGSAALDMFGSSPFADGASIGIALANQLLTLVPALLYFGWMQSTTAQASLGKMAVGIKVVRNDGGRVVFWHGVLREFAQSLLSIATCGLGLLVAAVVVGVSRRKQAPHDMICDTLVVDKHAFTPQVHLQEEGLGAATMVVLVLTGLLCVGLSLLVGFSIAMMQGVAR
jgi:uncharacterized RDD family membrane protein YckC